MTRPRTVRAVLLILAFLFKLTSASPAEVITTVAGGGENDVPALGASLVQFFDIGDVAMLPSGSLLVVGEHRVYRITPNGRLFVVAGNGVAGYSGDGLPATDAMLSNPSDVAADGAGNIYIADRRNNRVRKVGGSTGIITTLAGTGQMGFSGDGGPASSAMLGNLNGVAVDPQGNIYVSGDNRVRRIAAATGIITTVAGTGAPGFTGDLGPALAATFYVTTDIEFDATGNLFIVDAGNNRVRRVDGVTGIVTTVAGNGTSPQTGGDGQPATSVGLYGPTDIGIDPAGQLLIAEFNRVRRVDLTTGIISTIAHVVTRGIAMNPAGDLFIGEKSTVGRIDAGTQVMNTIAGLGTLRLHPDGVPAGRLAISPSAIAVAASGDLFYAEWDVIRRVSALDGRVETIAGGGSDLGEDVPALAARLQLVFDIEVDAAGNLYFLEGGYYVEPGPNNNGGFFGPNRVRRIDGATGTIRTVTRAGVLPVDMSFDGVGNLYIALTADVSIGPQGARCVIKWNAADGQIVTVAGGGNQSPFWEGDGLPATDVELFGPHAVVADPVSSDFYFADYGRVRRVSGTTGIISTVAGTLQAPGPGRGDQGFATQFPLQPSSLRMNDAGILLIGEGYYDYQLQAYIGRVWGLDLAKNWITAYAGNGLPGPGGDGGPALQARMAGAGRLTFDPQGRLLFTDDGRVRQVGVGGLANRPPTAEAGDDISIGCAAGSTSVTLDASASSDPDDDLTAYEWYSGFGLSSETLLGTGPVLQTALPSGSHEVTLRVEDRRGLSDLDEMRVEITEHDLQPPRVGATLSPHLLWPPHHHLQEVVASIDAGDDCGEPAIVLESIVSSEPDDAGGLDDGNTRDDIAGADYGTDDRAFLLRAERDGGGEGRTYTVTYRASDASGKTARAVATVIVPHDRAGVTEPVEIALTQTANGTVLAWGPVPGALSYDVVRGTMSAVRPGNAETSLGRVVCLEAGSIDLTTAGREDAEQPVAGECFFYLVAYDDGGASSFGEASAVKPRKVTSGGCQ